MNFIDHIESVSEEIENHFGFNTKVEWGKIKVESFIGQMTYEPCLIQYGTMAEFYRFCYCYAGKLHKYGLENKHLEIKKTNTK